jgi:hypothetical protein
MTQTAPSLIYSSAAASHGKNINGSLPLVVLDK